jgi:hypothetical protein
MDIVTALSIIKGLGIIADRVEPASLIGLLEDCPGGILQGINFKGIRTIGVGLLEDWVTQNDLFKLLDGRCAMGGPGKGYVLLSELGQRLGNIGETPDKWPLVAEYSYRAAYLFNGRQLFGPGG